MDFPISKQYHQAVKNPEMSGMASRMVLYHPIVDAAIHPDNPDGRFVVFMLTPEGEKFWTQYRSQGISLDGAVSMSTTLIRTVAFVVH